MRSLTAAIEPGGLAAGQLAGDAGGLRAQAAHHVLRRR